MTATLLDGKLVRDLITAELRQRIAAHRALGHPAPGLRVILVGDNPASLKYVASKETMARSLGMDSATLRLSADTSEERLLDVIASLNADDTIHGILVQMPLPAHMDAFTVVKELDPRKDVDGLHPLNQGYLLLGQPGCHPCTPKGVLRLLAHYDIDVSGMRATVIGRSILVGRPLAALLLLANATVTICHSRTPDLAEACRTADLVIAAVGIPGILTGDMIKEGAVVVDVGINSVNGKLVGDVDFATVAPRAAFLTPVPGGVGPMTIAMLMENTVLAYERTVLPLSGATSLTADPYGGALGTDLPKDPLFPTA